MKRNVVLIGMSGAGKSTLGVLLAKAVGLDFLDTDIVLQQRAGKVLQDILDEDGAERFLALEEEVICGLRVSGSVIATGGSVVYSRRGMAALREHGTTVYLSVPKDELLARLTNITTRGIVIRPGSSFDEVLEERLPLYDAYADITVDCADLDVEKCVSSLVERLSPPESRPK